MRSIRGRHHTDCPHDPALASGIGILYSFARVVPQADIFVTELQNWITAFFSLTLATNIICTSA